MHDDQTLLGPPLQMQRECIGGGDDQIVGFSGIAFLRPSARLRHVGFQQQTGGRQIVFEAHLLRNTENNPA